MEIFGAKPGRRIIVYFLAAILVGSIMLALPFSSTGKNISYLDALFTATSAVCVTGLTVVDTGADFSLIGQVIILILIQLGGIGVMTFATLLLLVAGAKLPFLDRLRITENFGTSHGPRPNQLLKAVLVTTFVIELIGAVLIYMQIRTDYQAGEAIFISLFHSISAFCNAGFSTFGNSLESFHNQPLFLMTIAILIICGGLGFIVIRDVLEKLKSKGLMGTKGRKRSSRLSLHSKICLSVSAFLFLGGALAIYIADSGGNSLGASGIDRVSNALFQSASSRTAGFSSFPQAGLSEVSLLVTMILMFIGACPGSTGGGIKTTTFAIVLLLIYNRFRGQESVPIFRRSISRDSIIRALTVLLLSLVVVNLFFAFLMFDDQAISADQLSHGWFVDNLFEVISAFSTVGLSLGITAILDVSGKISLIVLMFIGRVGLLTLAFTLARPPKKGELVYLDEPVMVG